MTSDFGVIYTPPRALLNKVPIDAPPPPEGVPAAPDSADTIQRGIDTANPHVVAVDEIRPGWEALLEAAEAAQARKANRRIIMRNVGGRLIPVGVSSSRAGATVPGSRTPSGPIVLPHGSSGRSRTSAAGAPLDGQLEQAMLMEAIRQSLVDHEQEEQRRAAQQQEQERQEQQQQEQEQPNRPGQSPVHGEQQERIQVQERSLPTSTTTATNVTTTTTDISAVSGDASSSPAPTGALSNATVTHTNEVTLPTTSGEPPVPGLLSTNTPLESTQDETRNSPPPSSSEVAPTLDEVENYAIPSASITGNLAAAELQTLALDSQPPPTTRAPAMIVMSNEPTETGSETGQPTQAPNISQGNFVKDSQASPSHVVPSPNNAPLIHPDPPATSRSAPGTKEASSRDGSPPPTAAAAAAAALALVSSESAQSLPQAETGHNSPHFPVPAEHGAALTATLPPAAATVSNSGQEVPGQGAETSLFANALSPPNTASVPGPNPLASGPSQTPGPINAGSKTVATGSEGSTSATPLSEDLAAASRMRAESELQVTDPFASLSLWGEPITQSVPLSAPLPVDPQEPTLDTERARSGSIVIPGSGGHKAGRTGQENMEAYGGISPSAPPAQAASPPLVSQFANIQNERRSEDVPNLTRLDGDCADLNRSPLSASLDANLTFSRAGESRIGAEYGPLHYPGSAARYEYPSSPRADTSMSDIPPRAASASAGTSRPSFSNWGQTTTGSATRKETNPFRRGLSPQSTGTGTPMHSGFQPIMDPAASLGVTAHPLFPTSTGAALFNAAYSRGTVGAEEGTPSTSLQSSHPPHPPQKSPSTGALLFSHANTQPWRQTSLGGPTLPHSAYPYAAPLSSNSLSQPAFAPAQFLPTTSSDGTVAVPSSPYLVPGGVPTPYGAPSYAASRREGTPSGHRPFHSYLEQSADQN